MIFRPSCDVGNSKIHSLFSPEITNSSSNSQVVILLSWCLNWNTSNTGKRGEKVIFLRRFGEKLIKHWTQNAGKEKKILLTISVSSWQVTIVTNSVPAVGGDSGEARCQGDMEKADMVDGKKLNVSCSKFLPNFLVGFVALKAESLQESRRVCAGRPLQRSTPTRRASTRRCARASKTC